MLLLKWKSHLHRTSCLLKISTQFTYEVWPHLLQSFQPRCQDKCWCCTFLKTTDFWICTSHTHRKHFLSDVVGLHAHELSFSSREEGEGMVWHLEKMSARQQTAPDHFSRLTQVFFVFFYTSLGYFQPCLLWPNLVFFNMG